jgi:uncharacterized protein (DUF433 family)/DNA-binding transcriptional MerR regulator
MPFPTHVAAALTGASLRQLQYWRAGGDQALFVPELPKVGGRVLYSFRDVLALRTFVYLREAVSLQRIRKAIDNLRELGNSDHLSRYRLVVAGRSIVLLAPSDDTATDLVEQPGAQRFTVALSHVLAPFENRRGDRVVDLFHPRRLVAVDPEIHGGYPVIDGTRVEFDLVASLVREGLDPEEIPLIYPSVSADGAIDAADFAAEVDRYRKGELGAA